MHSYDLICYYLGIWPGLKERLIDWIYAYLCKIMQCKTFSAVPLIGLGQMASHHNETKIFMKSHLNLLIYFRKGTAIYLCEMTLQKEDWKQSHLLEKQFSTLICPRKSQSMNTVSFDWFLSCFFCKTLPFWSNISKYRLKNSKWVMRYDIL